MNDRFDDKEFEHFVKQNADQYRMFPSEKVWNGIHNTLHSRRRWYGLGALILLVTSGLVTAVMLLLPANKKQISTVLQNKIKANNIVAPVAPEIIINPADQLKDNNKAPIQSTLTKNPFVAPVSNLKEGLPGKPNENIQTAAISGAVLARLHHNQEKEIFASDKTDLATISVQNNNIKDLLPLTGKALSEKIAEKANTELDVHKNLASNIIPSKESFVTKVNNAAPYTVESVINSYKYFAPRKKITWQLYLVPTISYRKLSENKSFIQSALRNGVSPASSFSSLADVNSVVTHRPDVGFEIGFNAGYPLTKNLKLIAGLQFNVSKYDIRAYRNPQEVTTIALNSGSGSANSISTYTSYRSYGSSSKASWLRNFYFSASAPVGAEIVFNSKKKSYVGFSGTVQPTYVLGNRAYLLSTDYKNYAEIPSLTRKWNINSSAEVFVGYNTGKLNWRIGPQVRYQALSSFVEKYPINEQLFDYGIKIGVLLK